MTLVGGEILDFQILTNTKPHTVFVTVAVISIIF